MTIAYTPREKCRRRTWTCSSTDSVSLRVETIFHVVYIHCKQWHDTETCSLLSLSSESYTNAGSRELCDGFSYFISSFYDVKRSRSREIRRLGGGIVLDLVGSRLEWIFYVDRWTTRQATLFAYHFETKKMTAARKYFKMHTKQKSDKTAVNPPD